MNSARFPVSHVICEPTHLQSESKTSNTPQPICKFCLDPQEDNKALLSGVCSCKGSLAHVHDKCLVLWQCQCANQTIRDLWNCELCGTRVTWPEHSVDTLVRLLAECRKESTATSKRTSQAHHHHQESSSRWQHFKRRLSRCASACFFTTCYSSVRVSSDHSISGEGSRD